MKKFGKLFGLTALAFATFTAGVIGLSGCGERWKNPHDDANPEEPPAIVTPPTEERPLIAIVDLADINNYLNSDDVKTRFDGVKMVASVPFDGIDESTGFEFSAIVGENAEDKKLVLKYAYADNSTVTNYVRGTEQAVYVKTETAEETTTAKIVDGETVGTMISLMNTAYGNVVDVKGQFASITQDWDRIDSFRYTAVQTSLKGDVSFEITFSYTQMEDVYLEETTQVEVGYTGRLVMEFVGGAIQSIRVELTRSEKDNPEIVTATTVTENITSLDFPDDLDTYVSEDEGDSEDLYD